MAELRMYTTSLCSYCWRAKRLLAARGIPFREINLDGNDEGRRELARAAGGATTVPQIWVGAVHVGGFSELSALDRRGGLDALLAADEAPSG